MRLTHLLTIAVTAAAIALAAGCAKETTGAPGDGGKPIKRACKMEGKCYLCPDDEAMKKCILNPGTSGCKLASESDCAI